MKGLRFDGQVAVVTGAGGNPGLGRSYAILLASLGAKVVVNDLGVGPDGRGTAPARAAAVVDEIVAAGGSAVVDCNSVATEAGAQAIVQTALDAFGGIDILINNAGVVEFALFDQLSSAHIVKVLDSHLMGTIWMCRAAWPHMRAAGYGRIVNMASASMIGARYSTAYGAAKGGVLGLTRNLAIEGADCGIKVNALAPGAATVAWTVMTAESGQPVPERTVQMPPELVAPSVAYLAHRECPASGKFIGSEGGSIFEVWFGRTAGVRRDSWTIEQVEEAWDDILDRKDFVEYGDPYDGIGGYTLNPRDYRPED